MNAAVIVNARIVTLQSSAGNSPLPRRGDAMQNLATIPSGFVRVRNGRITEVAVGSPTKSLDDEKVIDARGCVLLPGFVDCHTHACWAGDRLDEWEMKLAGRSYLDILAAGGGIMSTVRAVRAASTQDLAEDLMQRLLEMAAYGTTTAEVKTGYGLETETELRMFDAIAHAARHSPLRVAATFLGAHAIDPLRSECVEMMIKETLPAVAEKYPGITVDAYCETGAWSVADCMRYFKQAKQHGCGIRVHTDQFNSLGMIPVALELGAISVDHLEAATDADLNLVAKSKTIAVGLPATAFCLGTACIQARKFIDAGGALALATNANPGSAPVRAIPIVLSFAVREMKMTPAEAITSVTWNAACVLGMTDQCGSIAVGKSADMVLWPFKDERALGYELSGALPEIVIACGRVITPHSLAAG